MFLHACSAGEIKLSGDGHFRRLIKCNYLTFVLFEITK